IRDGHVTGVQTCALPISLHVGPGTFLPVQSDNIAEHRMHSEHFSISPEVARRINDARRIIAVGTTTVRTLESARGADGKVQAQEIGRASCRERVKTSEHA